MRPTTKLERRVDQLSLTLKDLTPEQRKWGLSRLIPHHATHKRKTHEAHCFDCGHSWIEDHPAKCPYCGAKLTVHKSARRRVFVNHAWYGIVQKVQEFTLIRIFFIKVTRRSDGRNEEIVSEILQHWVDDSGKDTIRAKKTGINSYYRRCPFSLDSEISIKRDRHAYVYRNPLYHINPDAFFPKISVSPILRRNGFRSSFHGIDPEDVICSLLTDNRFETLWKLRKWGWAQRYLFPDRDRIRHHWRAVLKCPPVSKQETPLYLDTMDLLEHFGISSKNWNIPSHDELHLLHDRLAKRKEVEDERRELMERMARDKKALSILESKSKYFGITFGNENLSVIVLSSLEEYRKEGKLQHHCVYSNAYYGKKDSLILSARRKEDLSKPVETVEISLRDGRILQCFGACNRFTKDHQEILGLVSDNSWRFIRS